MIPSLASINKVSVLELFHCNIKNWNDYILNEEYLPQRGAYFLLNNKNQIIYKFFSNDVLGYSSNMRDPLGFLTDLIKE